MRLLTDSEETGLLDMLVPGFSRLNEPEASRARRRCVRMIRERTGVSARSSASRAGECFPSSWRFAC